MRHKVMLTKKLGRCFSHKKKSKLLKKMNLLLALTVCLIDSKYIKYKARDDEPSIWTGFLCLII